MTLCGLVFALLAILSYFTIDYIYGETCPDSYLPISEVSEGFNSTVDDILYAECFFSKSYNKARDKFLQSARLAGAKLLKYNVSDELVTDVAIFHGRSESVFVHISGTHGPEGFSGSAIQAAALQLIAQDRRAKLMRGSGKPELLHLELPNMVDKDNPTMIFIHALNPYGFHNNRRVNEDNVDLNRNFLTAEQFEFVTNRDPNFAGYVDFEPLLNPEYMSTMDNIFALYFNDICGFYRMVSSLMKYGIGKIRRALLSGNYYKEAGLGFGGYTLSKSARNLIDIVSNIKAVVGNNTDETTNAEDGKYEIAKNLLEVAQEVILIDVHTGLGPSGVDTLAIDNAQQFALLDNTFPSDFDKSGSIIGGLRESTSGDVRNNGQAINSNMAGYDLTVGMLTKDFCNTWLAPHLPIDRKLCITQEFGTISSVIVGKLLVDENWAFHHAPEFLKKAYGHRLKYAFYPGTRSWKQSVLKRGLKVVLQSIQKLNSNKS